MQVCTADKCQLGQASCFFMDMFTRHKSLQGPQHATFSSAGMTTEQTATLCHTVGELMELTKKYEKIWSRQTPGGELEAHTRFWDLMRSIINLWWKGSDLWTCVLYKVGAKKFALPGLRKCLTLPRNFVMLDESKAQHTQDVVKFKSLCKIFFDTCIEVADNDKINNYHVVKTVKDRLKSLVV